MAKFFVTYGCGSNLNRKYSVVEADSYSEAQKEIKYVCGRYFAFCYDNEADFNRQIAEYHLTEVPLQAQVML